MKFSIGIIGSKNFSTSAAHSPRGPGRIGLAPVLALMWLASSLAAFALTIMVDPVTPLTNYWGAEWNGADPEGWVFSQTTNTAVAGGLLTGTASGIDPQVSLTALSNGPDLDLGYNDLLDLRIQLPAAYSGTIQIFYGTTTNSGISAARVLTIPATNIPTDGAFHTYRLDLGLEVWWRDQLRDVRIDPMNGATATGKPYALDYLRVGDLAGEVFLVNSNHINIYTGESLAMLTNFSSKHFTTWWSPQSYVQNAGFNPAVMPRRALRMMEESYQVFVQKMGYRTPFLWESSDARYRDGNRYKLNHLTWYGGFWMGGYDGFPTINVSGSGLGDEGWGNPTPHEFAHGVQGGSTNFLVGGHWESAANFMRFYRNSHYAALFPSRGDFPLISLEFANWHHDHKKLIYSDYRAHEALQSRAPDLGLPADFAPLLWNTNQANLTVWDKTAKILPAGFNVKDVAGYALRYWLFLDFPTRSDYATNVWKTADDRAWYFYLLGTYLIPQPDKPGWYRAPLERSPEKYSFAFHELAPTNATITATLAGFDTPGTGEDWRWSLIAENTNGTIRYSSVFTNLQTGSLTLTNGETRAYLYVCATPNDPVLDLENFHDRVPKDKHSSRLRYGYEVQLTGATPVKRRLDWTTAAGHTHPNGGGWVANTATVDSTAYVGPNARVLGTATVKNTARIEDFALITGSASVQNSAIVSGYATVKDSAKVLNNARVRDRAIVDNGSVVSNNAVVQGHADLDGTVIIRDDALLRGMTIPFGGTLSGTVIADYDYAMGYDLADGCQFDHIPWDSYYNTYFARTQKKPRGLIASYRTEETSGQMWWDEFGAQHALLRGSPARVTDAAFNSPVLRLDGVNDYVALDRSLGDLRSASFAIWVRPTASVTNQPLLFLGASAARYLQIQAGDATGKVRFRITDGTTVQELAATNALPLGAWTHLAVTLTNGTGRLYVNGTQVAQGSITLQPENVLGSDDYTTAEGCFLGRDYAGALFTGDLEDARFYNITLTAAEVFNEMQRGGAAVGRFYMDTVLDVTGTNVLNETGVRNGVERTLAAWVYPRTSADVTYFQPVLDSNYERQGTTEENGTTKHNYGSGFGLDAGKLVARIDGKGWWRPNLTVPLNQWTHLALAFNGTTAKLYTNFVEAATTTYSLTGVTLSPKNYRLGWGQADEPNGNGALYYFDGQIKEVKLWDQMIAPPTNRPPTLAAITNRTLVAGQTLTLTATATDADVPFQQLTWSLLAAPAGATLDPATGGFTWRPTVAQSPATNTIKVTVADNGTPSLSATNSFTVTVLQPARPVISGSAWSNGRLSFTVDVTNGPDCIVQVSTNLFNWAPLWTNVSPGSPFSYTNATTNFSRRFYRMLLGP